METYKTPDSYQPGEKLLLPRLPRSLPFDELVFIIEAGITEAIDMPYTFDHIYSTSFYLSVIRPIVASLVVPYDNFHGPNGGTSSSASIHSANRSHPFGKEYSFTDQHRGIVAALLVARLEFLDGASDGGTFFVSSVDSTEELFFKERGILEARAITAELVAIKLLSFMTLEKDRVEFLTYEYNIETDSAFEGTSILQRQTENSHQVANNPTSCFNPQHPDGFSSLKYTETSALLDNSTSYYTINPPSSEPWGTSPEDRLIEHSLFIEDYADQSALDLAVIGRMPAREFLSCSAVQSVVSGIWSGHVMYWETIDVGAKKHAHIYEPRSPVDWYSRLRVPRYRAFFMMINYATLMSLFYMFLFENTRQESRFVSTELLLNIWFIGFVLDEVSKAREAGSFGQYLADFWSFFDVCIVGVFISFAGLRLAGVVLGTDKYLQLSLNILSLEALLLVPRLFSFLSVFPYFGTLLPCLRDLTAEFFKFLIIIVIIYVGFLTTFTFLGQDVYSFDKMSWLLIRVFFGSSGTGFDTASVISPIFGPPLMLAFVTLTNILLITVLISILSQKFSDTMLRAKQEYALHFSSAVVQSVNTSERVTYFYPPVNILGILLRPLRLILDHDQYRELRIRVLQSTHWPFVIIVWAFEKTCLFIQQRKLKNYIKIRGDRRLSILKRLPGPYQPDSLVGNSLLNSDDLLNSRLSSDDMDVELLPETRHARQSTFSSPLVRENSLSHRFFRKFHRPAIRFSESFSLKKKSNPVYLTPEIHLSTQPQEPSTEEASFHSGHGIVK